MVKFAFTLTDAQAETLIDCIRNDAILCKATILGMDDGEDKLITKSWYKERADFLNALADIVCKGSSRV